MEKAMVFGTPLEAEAPKGPHRALKEAVELLAPFNFAPKERPGLDTSELLQADPEVLAAASIMNLAEYLNALLYRADHGPRVKEIYARFETLRGMLRDVSREISSLDDWSRFHLQNDLGELDSKLVPPFGAAEAGGFAELANQFAEHIEITMATLRGYYGGNKVVDRGTPQNHDERFFGSAKTRFVWEAFELFESYHPRCATSTEGAPFHTFVHRVYEYATNEPHEDRVALSHLLRKLITPLGTYQLLQNEYWSIEKQLAEFPPGSIEYVSLRERQSECDSEMRKLKPEFVPLLRRVVRVSPRPRKRR